LGAIAAKVGGYLQKVPEALMAFTVELHQDRSENGWPGSDASQEKESENEFPDSDASQGEESKNETSSSSEAEDQEKTTSDSEDASD
jgi:hypothetical protein